MEPSSSAGSKPLKKRITSLYSPSTPAVYYKYPSYTVTEPEPKIQNLPFPQRPLMTCEDNALAAFQAVSNATKLDRNFYVDQFGEYEKDWIDRDMRTSLARLMVATKASMRCRNKAQDRVFEKNREVQLAKGQRDYEKGEAEKYKTKYESCQQQLMIADDKVDQAKEALVKLQGEFDLLKISDEKRRRENLAAQEEIHRLRSENERLQKEVEEGRQRAAPVDLQAIKDAHLVDWIDEWHASSEGLEWIKTSGKGSQMQGYQMALRYLSSQIPSGFSGDLWGGIPKFDGITIDEAGNVTFAEEEDAEIEVDPAEIQRLLDTPDVAPDAAALAQEEQSLRDALTDTGLESEPRVDIPTTDEPADEDPKDAA
ncbi:hypothetical protein Dimus_038556 [Dionaea muscipula]